MHEVDSYFKFVQFKSILWYSFSSFGNFLAIVTRMGPWDRSMIRPLIRKAGKVPKEAGLDAGWRASRATKMKEGGGEASPALHQREHQIRLQLDFCLMNFTSNL